MPWWITLILLALMIFLWVSGRRNPDDVIGLLQQMLAIGRALMTNPKLLILDEATEGLAPLVRREIWACLAQLKAEGLSILVIDKNVRDLAAIADRHFIIEKGQIVWQGDSGKLLQGSEVMSRYLGF